MTIHQTVIVYTGSALIYEKSPASNVTNVGHSTTSVSSLLTKLNGLKSQIRQLDEGIKALERANAEIVDQTAGVSFETTVSVHSSDMSDELPNGI